MTDLLTGGCFCGAVRYQCTAPLYPATVCHCESCRRVSGSHVVTWISVALDAFAFIKAKPVEFSSSPRVIRTFCPHCGTPLTYRNEARAHEIDVTVATLDRAADVTPIDHVHMEDALPWDRPKDGLPQFAKSREEPS